MACAMAASSLAAAASRLAAPTASSLACRRAATCCSVALILVTYSPSSRSRSCSVRLADFSCSRRLRSSPLRRLSRL
jgi:hypothetical protein